MARVTNHIRKAILKPLVEHSVKDLVKDSVKDSFSRVKKKKISVYRNVERKMPKKLYHRNGFKSLSFPHFA